MHQKSLLHTNLGLLTQTTHKENMLDRISSCIVKMYFMPSQKGHNQLDFVRVC